MWDFAKLVVKRKEKKAFKPHPCLKKPCNVPRKAAIQANP